MKLALFFHILLPFVVLCLMSPSLELIQNNLDLDWDVKSLSNGNTFRTKPPFPCLSQTPCKSDIREPWFLMPHIPTPATSSESQSPDHHPSPDPQDRSGLHPPEHPPQQPDSPSPYRVYPHLPVGLSSVLGSSRSAPGPRHIPGAWKSDRARA